VPPLRTTQSGRLEPARCTRHDDTSSPLIDMACYLDGAHPGPPDTYGAVTTLSQQPRTETVPGRSHPPSMRPARVVTTPGRARACGTIHSARDPGAGIASLPVLCTDGRRPAIAQTNVSWPVMARQEAMRPARGEAPSAAAGRHHPSPSPSPRWRSTAMTTPAVSSTPPGGLHRSSSPAREPLPQPARTRARPRHPHA
jgi:hypothetical protein